MLRDRIESEASAEGRVRRLATLQLPLAAEISAASDGGRPLVLEHPENPASWVYRELAAAVLDQLPLLSPPESDVGGSECDDGIMFDAATGQLEFRFDGAAQDGTAPVRVRPGR